MKNNRYGIRRRTKGGIGTKKEASCFLLSLAVSEGAGISRQVERRYKQQRLVFIRETPIDEPDLVAGTGRERTSGLSKKGFDIRSEMVAGDCGIERTAGLLRAFRNSVHLFSR
jgi:hypothetical protein